MTEKHLDLTVSEHAELRKDKTVDELAAYEQDDASWADLPDDITWGEFTELHKEQTWGELQGEENH